MIAFLSSLESEGAISSALSIPSFADGPADGFLFLETMPRSAFHCLSVSRPRCLYC